MKTCLVAVGLFLLAHGSVAAQTGDAQAGKALWEGPATLCRNCHGTKGEGGLGPDLAGRKLTLAQFTRAVRKPWGIMPAFVESQMSDKELADFLVLREPPARRTARRVEIRGAGRCATRAGSWIDGRVRSVTDRCSTSCVRVPERWTATSSGSRRASTNIRPSSLDILPFSSSRRHACGWAIFLQRACLNRPCRKSGPSCATSDFVLSSRRS